MNFNDPTLYGATLPQREFPIPTPAMGPVVGPHVAQWQPPYTNLPWQGLTPPWQGFQRVIPPMFHHALPPSIGYTPQTYGYTPQTFGYAPQNLGYAPHNFGYAPQAYGYAPQNYGYAPQSFGHAPQFYPTPLGTAVGTVGAPASACNVAYNTMPYNWAKTY